jgi:type II secretory pathway pseudopilin PulG
MNTHPRGFTLVFVLFAILLMTITATAYFSSTVRGQSVSIEVSAQQMAVSRAQMAAQQAVLDLRANRINPSLLPSIATPDGVTGCLAPSQCLVRVEGNGTALSLNEGGGMQWDYVIYKTDNFLGRIEGRYTIQANGYYGYTPTSTVFNQSRFEVEIDVGSDISSSGPGSGENSGAL